MNKVSIYLSHGDVEMLFVFISTHFHFQLKNGDVARHSSEILSKAISHFAIFRRDFTTTVSCSFLPISWFTFIP